MIRTPDGIAEIIPGLSTWTAEDLLEAGAWDEELSELADLEGLNDVAIPDDYDRD